MGTHTSGRGEKLNRQGNRHGKARLMQALERRAYRAEIDFDFGTNFAAGTEPQGITVADFNKDGKLDVAVSNFSGGVVSVLKGNGTGGLVVPASFTAGTNLSGILSGDLNNDQKVDLVAIGNDVGILTGKGDGTFNTVVHVAAGNTPQTGAIADVNGDNKLDIIIANILSNNVSVLLGNGNATFQAAVNYNAGTGAAAVAVGDLNGDGKVDLAVASMGDLNTPAATGSGVNILLGNGNGTFGAAQSYAAGLRPISVAVGDVNNDGILDVVSVNGGFAVNQEGSNNASVLLGNGNGTFKAAVNHETDAIPQGVQLADFNVDGNLDFIVANVNGNSLNPFTNNGDGTFHRRLPNVGSDGTVGVGNVAVGDFNGDKLPDVVSSNSFTNNVSVMLNELTPVSSAGGIITVIGTPADDTITLTVSGANLNVLRNGVTTPVPLAGAVQVQVTTAGGNDSINAATVTLPVVVYAGAGNDNVATGTGNDVIDTGAGNDVGWSNDGNDKIIGGDGEDTLSGGANKDTLFGSSGNDRLNGNGGNDRLFGEAGADRLYGYDGNDAMDGGSSGDRFEGGGGTDTAYGQSGDDRFFSADGIAESLFGASGNDSALSTDPSDILSSVEVH